MTSVLTAAVAASVGWVLLAELDYWFDVMTPYVGRHRIGVAVGAPAQRARWDAPTGEFPVLATELRAVAT